MLLSPFGPRWLPRLLCKVLAQGGHHTSSFELSRRRLHADMSLAAEFCMSPIASIAAPAAGHVASRLSLSALQRGAESKKADGTHSIKHVGTAEDACSLRKLLNLRGAMQDSSSSSLSFLRWWQSAARNLPALQSPAGPLRPLSNMEDDSNSNPPRPEAPGV